MITRRLVVLFAALAVGFLASQQLVSARADKSNTKALEGKPAPEVALKTLDGKDVKLSEQKGSVVMMDFWATWCPPCRKSLPHVQKLSADKELAAKGLVVWAVNARETQDKVTPFLKENSYTFAVPMDAEGSVMSEYKVQGIPTTVIVGRDGTIKTVFVGYGEGMDKKIHDAIEKALAEPAPGKTS